ncbi:MAG TPA: DUF885 domain-containing protein [Vicinamibacteria bacterium]|nr:DUF885 domain-containing protein [Vicinamibacteria bacterium]
MVSKSHILLAAAMTAGVATASLAAPPPPPEAAAAARPGWFVRSDEHAKVPLGQLGRFSPEFAGFLGVEGLDREVFDLKPGLDERSEQATRASVAELESRLAAEKDPRVRQDLEIMIRAGRDNLAGALLNRRYLIPYFDVPQTIFLGLQALLDDQVPPERRAAALVRLRRYAGGDPGYTPILELARDRVRERLSNPALLGPARAELEKNLGNSAFYVDGIAKLFTKYGIAGYEEAHGRLKRQVAAYDEFLRQELMPRARTDFRLPPELYAFSLRQFGVDVPPDLLAERARVSFMEIRNEMRALAPLVARERGLAATDYREVIRALKKDQLVGAAILSHYQQRLRDLEEIIRRERIATLPRRPARIRIASEAEAASTPAPNLRAPRLIGNTGELAEFILPLNVPTSGGAGTAMQSFDDFTFDAAAWTLTVHEARPGHEMQFASLAENGVSVARAVFAFNSVNVEGWALYTEAEMKPYLPLDGQLIALQHRMLRAVRAFLDPDLQAGRIEPEPAVRFLMEEVVLSEPMARQEVERYTFRSPGQATSYFHGYTRWMALKAETEMALGARFDRQRYHDFILAQGLLPPDMLGQALRSEFVPAERARGTH